MHLPIQYVHSQYDVWRDPEAGAMRIRWELYAFNVCVGPDLGWLGSVPDAPPKTVACLGDILLYMPIWRRAIMECKEVCIPGWEQFQCCVLTKPTHSNANWVYHMETHVLYPLFPRTKILYAWLMYICSVSVRNFQALMWPSWIQSAWCCIEMHTVENCISSYNSSQQFSLACNRFLDTSLSPPFESIYRKADMTPMMISRPCSALEYPFLLFNRLFFYQYRIEWIHSSCENTLHITTPQTDNSSL